MKKPQNNSTCASALQIVFAVVLMSGAAFFLGASFTPTPNSPWSVATGMPPMHQAIVIAGTSIHDDQEKKSAPDNGNSSDSSDATSDMDDDDGSLDDLDSKISPEGKTISPANRSPGLLISPAPVPVIRIRSGFIHSDFENMDDIHPRSLYPAGGLLGRPPRPPPTRPRARGPRKVSMLQGRGPLRRMVILIPNLLAAAQRTATAGRQRRKRKPDPDNRNSRDSSGSTERHRRRR